MLDRMYDSPKTGPYLALAYIILIWCGPWYSDSLAYYRAEKAYYADAGKAPTEESFLRAEGLVRQYSEDKTKEQIQNCSKQLICTVILVRFDEIIDRSTSDPVAFFTLILAFSTIGLWIKTSALAKLADRQATDLQSQLVIARDDFVSTHRPWMTFRATLGSKGAWFDAAGAHVAIDFNCENTGSTPAIGVSINAEAYLWSPVGDELERQKQICARLTASEAQISVAGGTTVFPGGKWTFPCEYVIPKAILDTVTSAPKNIVITIAGCVDYLFSFGKVEAHQSGFIYYVGKPQGANGVTGLPEVVGTVPPPDVRLLACRLMNAFKTT